jgi:hypothetical protein
MSVFNDDRTARDNINWWVNAHIPPDRMEDAVALCCGKIVTRAEAIEAWGCVPLKPRRLAIRTKAMELGVKGTDPRITDWQLGQRYPWDDLDHPGTKVLLEQKMQEGG